jgi:hypothetical protein
MLHQNDVFDLQFQNSHIIASKNIYRAVNVIIKTNRIQYKNKDKKHIPNNYIDSLVYVFCLCFYIVFY